MNQERRKFLKFLAIGGGALLANKLLGDKLTTWLSAGHLSGKNSQEEVKSQDVFGSKNTKVIEDEREIVFFDKSGEKILVLEKE